MAAQKTKFAVDTSVVVPLLAGWHENHDLVLAAWTRLRSSSQPVLISNVMLEAFSVLTRLPPPYRASAAPVREAIQVLASHAELVGVTPSDCLEAMNRLESQSLGGGAIYDAAIAVAASRAGASLFLTLNLRDHLRVAPPSLRIAHPSEFAG